MGSGVETGMIRAFVAVEIPVIREVEELIEALRNCRARLSVPKASSLHITMKFLGDIDQGQIGDIREVMKTIAAEFQPFEARIVGVGAFPNRRKPRILWLGIEDDGSLGRIAEGIDSGLASVGFAREQREFRSHVTIARIKSGSNLDQVMSLISEKENSSFGRFQVMEMKLKKSTLTPSGAIYDDLEVIGFG